MDSLKQGGAYGFLSHVTLKGGSHDVSYEVLGAGTGS